MPITLPETLPAFDVLAHEGVMVMSPERAARVSDITFTPSRVSTSKAGRFSGSVMGIRVLGSGKG